MTEQHRQTDLLADNSTAGERLDFIESEQARAGAALEPDGRLIYGVWGAAWLVGFLTLWAAASGSATVVPSMPVALLVLGAALIAAMVTTVVHVARRTAGLRGVSDRAGAMYGWAWFLSFACLTVIMMSLRSTLSEEMNGLLWTVLSGLVVGALYLAGGALWQDRTQYGIGVWILVATAAGALAGWPGAYLVMALAGGGGFLLAALVLAARGRRS